MQRALLNRATMRVAETTEVSGRLTADEIKRLMNIQFGRGTRVLLKHLAAWGIPLGMLTIFAMPAVANHIDTANVSVACDSYTICVAAENLVPGTSYTITYEITVTPSSGTPMTISNSIPFTASDTTFSTFPCVSQSLGPLTGTNTFSGSATLVGHNTIAITFSSPNPFPPLSCPTPCPTLTPTPTPSPCPPCAQSCIQSNFNGTAIGAGDTIWFNAHIQASGIPSSGQRSPSAVRSLHPARSRLPFPTA